MKRFGAALLCGLLLAVNAGCLERTTAALRPTAAASAADIAVPRWQYAGSFGGRAALSTDSPDPWERRYEAGKFGLLAGIDASADEVWACDLAISRIQVFDPSGRLLRSIGSGVPLAGTLPTDVELYSEEQSIDPAKQPKWEEGPDGQRWVKDKRGLFKAADVALLRNGYWMSDQMQSSAFGQRQRSMACRFYGDDGSLVEMQVDGGPLWPSYLAAAGGAAATAEQFGNSACLAKLNAEGIWEIKRPPGGPQIAADFRRIVGVKRDQARNPRYAFLLELASGAGGGLGQFDFIGGLAFYNGKLLVCDQRNRRIQVFEGRPSEGANWGQPIKVVTAPKYEGGLRFGSPRAVDVSAEGLVYVLDGERREVAILSPTFERLATLNTAVLEDPYDIALSSDGKQLFISDPGRNLIHRYAAD